MKFYLQFHYALLSRVIIHPLAVMLPALDQILQRERAEARIPHLFAPGPHRVEPSATDRGDRPPTS